MTPKGEVTEEMLSAIDKAVEAADPGPWKYKEKRTNADPWPSHVRRAGGEYEDESLDDGSEVVTEWCNNLQYIAVMSPDVAQALVSELRVTRRALEMASTYADEAYADESGEEPEDAHSAEYFLSQARKEQQS